MTPRQHSANDGLKPGPQTVPQDFTEGADERHLGSSTNLPLIMSTVPTPHGTTRASLFLSAASPSPAAQAFPQEPRGPSRRASSRRTLEQAPLPHQHPHLIPHATQPPSASTSCVSTSKWSRPWALNMTGQGLTPSLPLITCVTLSKCWNLSQHLRSLRCGKRIKRKPAS